MLSKARQLIGGVIGGGSADRSEAAQKAAQTRKAEADKRSQAARKAAQTRKRKAAQRRTSAKRGATTRAKVARARSSRGR